MAHRGGTLRVWKINREIEGGMAEIEFDGAVCRDVSRSARREWLETNGIGGYASSTVSGVNTRRYHGLLVAATRPPVGRMVLLSKFEETLTVDGKAYELSANRYPGAVHPEGYRYLAEFRLEPFPTFVYRVGGAELEKSVFMVDGENTTAIRYELRGGTGTLEVRPLIAFRDYHATTHENGALNPALEVESGCVGMTPYEGLPTLYLAHDAEELRATGVWYRNCEYDIERARGLDFREDLFQPCSLRFVLGAGVVRDVIASTRRRRAGDGDELRRVEIGRREAMAATLTGVNSFVRRLARAADQFIVDRGDGKTVIAGYPWFTDWGRDTMIALPGLTLARGRAEVAKQILRAYAESVDRGMLPNRFPDGGEAAEYNTVDATLWFFEAARAYLAYTGDEGFVRNHLYGVLEGIVDWHVRGTRYGIRMDEDGLLRAGEAGVQLTWMDARVGDRVVTPRQGKPVEIQALWYNALRVMEALAGRLGGGDGKRYGEMADRARSAFGELFPNPSAGGLYDVVDGESRDASIRPNQIFAVSLFHTMLSREQALAVVETVRRHLLTPFGLRTLAPSDPQYKGRFEGGPAERDGAYHQGTVWPWLMGPFLKAYMRTGGRREQAEEWLRELDGWIADEGVGQIPEVFDGDPPHRAGGCMAQAWSVAELLRTCVEDVYGVTAV